MSNQDCCKPVCPDVKQETCRPLPSHDCPPDSCCPYNECCPCPRFIHPSNCFVTPPKCVRLPRECPKVCPVVEQCCPLKPKCRPCEEEHYEKEHDTKEINKLLDTLNNMDKESD